MYLDKQATGRRGESQENKTRDHAERQVKDAS